MPIDYFIDVFPIDIAVPDGLGIDHDNRAQLAAIQAAGSIDAHPALARHAKCLDFCLGVLPDFAGIEPRAAHLAALALVGTEKDVVFVI